MSGSSYPKYRYQCYGSVTFWYGSGSAPLTNRNPAVFALDLQDANKKLFNLNVHLLHFSKVLRKSQNSRNKGFSYYFCLMIDGSRAGSGSVPHVGEKFLTAGQAYIIFFVSVTGVKVFSI
jgi:hypothetical protein